MLRSIIPTLVMKGRVDGKRSIVNLRVLKLYYSLKMLSILTLLTVVGDWRSRSQIRTSVVSFFRIKSFRGFTFIAEIPSFVNLKYWKSQLLRENVKFWQVFQIKTIDLEKILIEINGILSKLASHFSWKSQGVNTHDTHNNKLYKRYPAWFIMKRNPIEAFNYWGLPLSPARNTKLLWFRNGTHCRHDTETPRHRNINGI